MSRRVFFMLGLVVVGCRNGATPAAGKDDSPTTPGPRHERPQYVVELAPPPAAAPGSRVSARVRVEARGGFHVNADYPLAFTPDTVDGLRFESKRLALSQTAERTPCADALADTCAIGAPVPITVDKSAKLSGVLAFSICEPDQCLIEKVPLVVDVVTE